MGNFKSALEFLLILFVIDILKVISSDPSDSRATIYSLSVYFYFFAGFTFAVAASYVGNNIVLAIDSSSEGVFCCQLDIGTCILCKSLKSYKCILQVSGFIKVIDCMVAMFDTYHVEFA